MQKFFLTSQWKSVFFFCRLFEVEKLAIFRILDLLVFSLNLLSLIILYFTGRERAAPFHKFLNNKFKTLLQTVNLYIWYRKKTGERQIDRLYFGSYLWEKKILDGILPNQADSKSELWFWLLETVQKSFLTSQWKSISDWLFFRFFGGKSLVTFWSLDLLIFSLNLISCISQTESVWRQCK